uniref:Uncharacterized protein n=2 Tax=Oryza meridionalis TaxID=40149 RepID=A0A0E0CFM1_9ORYZ
MECYLFNRMQQGDNSQHDHGWEARRWRIRPPLRTPTRTDPAALGRVWCGCGRHDGGSGVDLARVMADATVTSDCGREARWRRIRPPLRPTHTARPPRQRA